MVETYTPAVIRQHYEKGGLPDMDAGLHPCTIQLKNAVRSLFPGMLTESIPHDPRNPLPGQRDTVILSVGNIQILELSSDESSADYTMSAYQTDPNVPVSLEAERAWLTEIFAECLEYTQSPAYIAPCNSTVIVQTQPCDFEDLYRPAVGLQFKPVDYGRGTVDIIPLV